MYKSKIQLRLRAGLSRLGYNNSLLPSRRSGSSRARRAERGLAQETEQKRNPFRTYKLLTGLNPKQTRRLAHTTTTKKKQEKPGSR